MRRLRRALLLCLSLFAAAVPAHAQTKNLRQKQFEPFLTRGETTWSISLGARQNKTGFEVASDITGTVTPNVLSQDHLDDVTLIELQGKVRHVEPLDLAFIRGGVMAEAELTGGIILDGFAQRSIYAGDFRTNEVARASTNKMKGDAIGGSVAVGYQIHLTGTPGQKARNIVRSKMPGSYRDRMRKEQYLQKTLNEAGPYISVTPLAGYGADQQTYTIEEGFTLIPVFDEANFDTDYIANWYGPFFGMEGEIRNKRHMLRLRGEYHDLTYDARLEDHVAGTSLDNEADGNGYLLGAEYALALGDDYALTLEGFYQKRETDRGTHNLSATDTVLLYEVDDESQGMRAGLRYIWD